MFWGIGWFGFRKERLGIPWASSPTIGYGFFFCYGVKGFIRCFFLYLDRLGMRDVMGIWEITFYVMQGFSIV
jgi:hypothetical protein